VFRADVGSEDGGADDPPAEISAGKEVIVGGVLAPSDDPPGDDKDKAEVHTDGDPIQRLKITHDFAPFKCWSSTFFDAIFDPRVFCISSPEGNFKTFSLAGIRERQTQLQRE